MTKKEDLLSLWLNKNTSQSSSNASEPIVPKPGLPHAEQSRPDSSKTVEIPADKRSNPTLSGQLAQYLSEQNKRSIQKDHFEANEKSWEISDANTRAVVAMSLVLAEHIAHYAGTTLDETRLVQARNALFQTFGPRDAVKIEVEAYELIQWFAGAMNPEWKASSASEQSNMIGDSSKSSLVRIITDAIQKKRDLMMRYYTVSRGEVSERQITPIEITAEKYLIAFCHVRQEERVFRLSRILELKPILEPGSNECVLCFPNKEDTKIPKLEYALPEPANQTESSKRPKSGSKKGNDHSPNRQKSSPSRKKTAHSGGRQLELPDAEASHAKSKKTNKSKAQASEPKNNGPKGGPLLPGFD